MNKSIMFRRGLSLLLALLLTLALLPAAAAAEGAEDPAQTAPEEVPAGAANRSETYRTVHLDLSSQLLHLGGFPQASPEEEGTLFEDREGARSAIRAGLRNRAETIDVSAYGIPSADAGNLYFEVLNNHPDFFYVGGHISWSYDSTGMTASLFPEYDDSYSAEDIAAFYQTADAIAAQIDPSWDASLKLLFLHDYIVTHCQYDLTYSKYNAYNALMEHSAVCQGYSLAFQYLLQLAGFESWIVSSEAMNHAWNLLRIGEAYFFVDCTWDDPTCLSDGPGGQSTHYYEAFCAHDNFLRSYAGIQETGHTSDDWVISGWSGAALAVSDAYESAFWKNVATPVAIGEDSLAYVYQDDRANVFTRNLDGSGETAHPVTGSFTWYVWGETNQFWGANYSSFALLNGEIYYSTPTEIVLLRSDGTMETVYTLSAEEAEQGYIYGILPVDGALRYSVGPIFYGDGFLRKSFVPSSVVPVSGITLNKTELALMIGESETLISTVTPEDATDRTVSWQSSAPGIATVDENGQVTAVGGGTAVITAAAGDVSATCEVTVTVPVGGITLNKTELALVKGESETLIPAVTPEDATDRTVHWSTDAPGIVTVDENGLVTAVGVGSATVRADAGDKSDACTVTVKAVPDATQIEAAAVSEGSVTATGYVKEAGVRLVLAVYDSQNRMTECRMLELPESGGWRESVSFAGSFARAQVFLLDSGNKPLCESKGT